MKLNSKKILDALYINLFYPFLVILFIITLIVVVAFQTFSSFSYSGTGTVVNSLITGEVAEPKLKCDSIANDTSGANSPKESLPTNMIPVCYNSEKNVWLKADSTNSNSDYQWYSYSDKIWANAVTVKNEGYVSKLNESTFWLHAIS